MKYFHRVLIISVLASVTLASMQKHYFEAFRNISKALAVTNHEVSVISLNGTSDFIEFAVLPNFRDNMVPHSVIAFENLNSIDYNGINTSAVIAFDSIDSLKNFNNETYTCNKPKFNGVTTLKSDFYYPFQFFVYCDGMTEKDLLMFEDNPPPYRSILLRHEYFIVDDGDVINLWTFVWYTPGKCNQMQLVLVNKFSKKTQKWDHDTFVIEKFANIHGCLLNFYFLEVLPSFVTVDPKVYGKHCVGYLCQTAQVLSEKLNFTYFSHVELSQPTEKAKAAYDLRWLVNNLATAMQVRHEASFCYFSTPFDFLEVSIAIPRGEELNSYDRIVLPFDTKTWIWLAMTFAAAFTTIFIIKFMNVDIRNFIIGRDISTPSLNVIRIFFGITQIHCPARNFARFLVMSFILFCIVIRTAYQGKMFEFLQKDLVKHTFDTVDELIDHNFTFFMRIDFSKYYKGSDFVKRAKIADTWLSLNNFMDTVTYVQEPGNKVAMEIDPNLLLILSLKNATLKAKVLRERFIADIRVIYFKAHHSFFNSFNEKFKQMFEAGLFDYYIRQANELYIRNIKKQPKEPSKVLTLEELEAGFIVCIVPLLLAIVVFCFEWIVTLKDLVVVFCIFQAFYKSKHVKMDTVIRSEGFKGTIWKILLTTQARDI